MSVNNNLKNIETASGK